MPGSDGEQDGVALAAAAAQRGGAEAAAAALELVQQGEGDPGAGHADRVAEGDGAAVDVDDVVGDAEVLHRGQADGGEGLVELEQVDVADRLAGALEAATMARDGCVSSDGSGPGHLAVADDLAQRVEAERSAAALE